MMKMQAIVAKRGSPVITGLKALGLVAAAWGVVYPALLWGLGSMLP